jgi:hypothetical protein
MATGFLGLGSAVTDNEIAAVAIDVAAFALGAGLSYHFIIKPTIEWVGKKKEEPKPEPETPGPKGGKKVDPKPEPSATELLKKYEEQDAVKTPSVEEIRAAVMGDLPALKKNLTPEKLEGLLKEFAPHRQEAKEMLKSFLTSEELGVILDGLGVIEDVLAESQAELEFSETKIDDGEKSIEDLEEDADEAIAEMQKATDAFVAKYGQQDEDGGDDLEAEWNKRAADRRSVGSEVSERAARKAKAKERKAAQRAKANGNA